MRLILILVVLIAAFVVVQNHRHGCSFGQAGWMGCLMGSSTEATPASSEAPAPAAEPAAPAAEPAAPAAEPAPAPAPQ